jgi:hypothetical protein
MQRKPVRNRPATPPTCIYCRSTTNPFNREHAINEAFGTFKVEPDLDFYLRDMVCQPCNQSFGDSIDLALGRDSAEAVLRFTFNLKSPAKARQLQYKRLRLKFWIPGEFFGAYFELGSDAVGLNLVPIFPPQIGLRWKGTTKTKWLLESEVSAEAISEYRHAPKGNVEMLILGPHEEDRARVESAVRIAGIPIRNKRDVAGHTQQDDQIVTQVSMLLDSRILRAVAKIAFNYVACVHGAGFVLRSDFNDLRNYIRYGTESGFPFVVQANGGILTGEPRESKFTNGHLITLEWNRAERGLLSRVSLFNHAKYHVLFCTHYSGVWSNELVSGHHFDIKTGEVSSLFSSSKIQIIGVGIENPV